jgi:primary-amine oxidase
MTLERLKQAAAHVTGLGQPPHPFDPLSETEIERAVAIVRKEYNNVFFNAVTLWEPRKAEMMKWIKDPEHHVRPHRVADVVCIGKGSKVFDAIVDLTEGKIIDWDTTEGVQPLVWELELLEFQREDTNSWFRLRWKICKLWRASCAKTPR